MVLGIETEEIVPLAEYLNMSIPRTGKLVDVLERATGEDTLEYRIVKTRCIT